MPTAQTSIRTDRADRYLAQLCRHLNEIGDPARHSGGTRSAGPPQAVQVEQTGRHGVIEFTFGRCTLDATDDALVIHLAADDDHQLQRMKVMFAGLLQSIGRRDNLRVQW